MGDAKPLQGQVAVITGGAGAIGSAIARSFGAAGALVVLLGRSDAVLADAAHSLLASGYEVRTHTCDVSQGDQVERVARAVGDALGSVDVLCTCAGVMNTGAVDDIDPKAWDEMIATNVTGTFLAIRSFLTVMRDASSVVTIASTAGLRPVPGFAAYTTSKAAVIHLTQACALDLAPRGIRVNCICPGVVRSHLHDGRAWPPADLLYDAMAQATPLGWLGSPEDVARVALHLAEPAARWMTGVIVAVDGGLALV